ncbi:MAG: tryptophan--tRNA ligase [Candidatus Magasanikbacteria bacterium]
MSDKPTLVSGIKPTGNMHIGNYLGAVKNWIDLQESGDYNCIFFIADYHSLTIDLGSEKRHDQIYKTAAEYIAAGIDPEKCTFFVQSHVPAHTELAWIFNCVTSVGELKRMTQYKSKADENPNSGLFTYPVLMAADILLYKGEVIPVGEDQIQHLELNRKIARNFNNRFDTDYFPEPEPELTETPRVKSLKEPESKMSKSKGDDHVIELADSPEVIEEKVKKAVTATEGGGEKIAPGVKNLLLFLEKFGDQDTYEKYLKKEKSGEIKYGYLKQKVSSAISEYFSDFREKRSELIQDRDKLADILIQGAEEAQEIAQENISDIREIVGVR